MIGALALSKEFEKLETASREGDSSYISENHLKAVENYRDIIKLISPIAETINSSSAEMIDGERAKEIALRLLDALDDFDDELSKDLANKLNGYQFGSDQKEELNEALGLINDFLYDDAAEIIKRISVTIK